MWIKFQIYLPFCSNCLLDCQLWLKGVVAVKNNTMFYKKLLY